MWHIIVFNALLLAGVAIGIAAIPTLVLAAVPPDASGAASGVNALMRSIGSSAGATVTGMLLAASSVPVGGNELPQPGGFTAAFALGLATAVVCAALVWSSAGAVGDRA
ncbi:hypothetical protein [Rhodococcus sp. IEGM 1408]|uniref:hypothetical protein n=1 Tax=Rhodococcus sp. IEGM 1408 TaxID=3082220 RepID=UPI0029539AF4|nr:hypothetical protein [Rhodococcus sp. IEGM 1408]MDV8002245.1 hypothetical protein [Rhodococcus sp. IEGM 1408]